ncbi:MAG: small, acid-soluble spore protein, alpha/beta type [Clostridia bacterium]|nr:small, acid-soluble spore protein, alpha/beta type [Clostridia bacterium]MBP3800530.1 small, acid-soluble spore protein, alpha/beta type [Clostridia bacterium]
MSRNRKLMSENLREEIAKELGVFEQVKNDGGSWRNVSAKNCGSIVSKAIEIANRAVEK